MEQTGLQLHTVSANRQRAVKLLSALCGAIILLSLLALLLLPSAMEGLKLLCNLLFDASEAMNPYVYNRFSVAESAAPQAAAYLLTAGLLALCGFIVLQRCRGAALVLLIVLAGTEVYFGVSLPVWMNLLLFTLLGSQFLQSPQSALPYLLCALTVALLVSGIAPGVHVPTELASEAVRDRMDILEHQILETLSPTETEPQKTDHENRLDSADHAGDSDAAPDRAYQYQQELEQEISRPKSINYVKIILLFLLLILLLTVPFLPFVLLDSRRKKALARREKFDSADCSAALCAMFLHIIAYLESCGINGGNRPFSQWAEVLPASLPEQYADQFKQAVALWQEAAYSEHTLSVSQLSQMQEILQETERLFYDEADRKTKFRLKYLECLHP